LWQRDLQTKPLGLELEYETGGEIVWQVPSQSPVIVWHNLITPELSNISLEIGFF
jgi:hypothetical protein